MITEETMNVEAMKKKAKSHKCGVCGGVLNVAWGGSLGYNGYILRCRNIDHDVLTDYKKPTPEYEEGNKLFRRLNGMDTTALMKMNETQMMARIAQAKFPKDLTAPERKLMAEVSISYGLDPLMQELMIYQGNPYLTINARYRKAQETGKFDGINTRPATKEEQETRHAKEGDYLYCAEVWVKGSSHPFIGWGRVRAAETKGSEHLPIVKDPDRQAEKRAEAMGLRKAFSMPVPFQSWEELQEEEAGRVIDTETGEIIEAEVVETKEKRQETEAKEQASTPTAALTDEIPQSDEEAKKKAEELAPKVKEKLEKDESQASPESVEALKKLAGKAGKSMMDLGSMMAKELKWQVPKTLQDLQQWQVEKLTDILNKALG